MSISEVNFSNIETFLTFEIGLIMANPDNKK